MLHGLSSVSSLSLNLSLASSFYLPSHLVTEFEKGFSVIYSPPANATELRQLYLEHARPLVGEMTQQNYDTSYRHRPLLLAYYEVDWSRDGFKGERETSPVVHELDCYRSLTVYMYMYFVHMHMYACACYVH